MDTLDRYLIRESSLLLFSILIGITCLYLGIDFLGNFWRGGLPMSVVAELYLYRVPATLSLFMPLSCLLATFMIVSAMSRQNEILALYSGSISTIRILSTFVALIAVVSTASFLILDPLVPLFNRKHLLLKDGRDPSSTENLISFRNNFWYRSGHVVYNFGKYLPETNTLKGVRIYVFTPSFYMLESIRAKEAQFVDGDWVLRDGATVTYPTESLYPISTPFDVKRKVIPEQPKDFRALEVRDDTMRLRDLREYIHRNQEYGLDTTAQQVIYQDRVALVFTPLVLILLAFPFALKPLKTSSTARSVAFCFGIVLCYVLISRLSLSVGKGGHIPPLIAAWAPNILFLGVASFRLLRTKEA